MNFSYFNNCFLEGVFYVTMHTNFVTTYHKDEGLENLFSPNNYDGHEKNCHQYHSGNRFNINLPEEKQDIHYVTQSSFFKHSKV